MLDPDLISTAELRAELLAVVTEPAKVPGYRALSDRQRDGRWPVLRVAGRPYVRRADLPRVVSAIGLELKSVEVTQRKRVTAPAPSSAKATRPRKAA